MRCLVIGYGSIGARHARLLQELGAEVACVSNNIDCIFPVFSTVEQGLKEWKPERIVVANKTIDHFKTFKKLSALGCVVPVLMEKPLFHALPEKKIEPTMPVYVAYNLRFHPIIAALRRELGENSQIFSAEFHVGQHLSQWRPGRDYHQTYSAKPEQGGGVLRDLSHELDLALWLCGAPTKIAALGGAFSDLGIESDDIFSLLMQTTQSKLVTVTVNYIDRMPQRRLLINVEGKTILADLITSTLCINGVSQIFSIDSDVSYRHELIAFLHEDSNFLCRWEEGLAVMNLIAIAEQRAYN